MTTDLKTIAADFLAIVPEQRRAFTEAALAVIFEGVEAGEILNVDFKDAKRTLDYSADKAWDSIVGPFTAGKGGCIVAAPYEAEANVALRKIDYANNLSYVRDAIAISKRLAKVAVEHEMVSEMRRVVAAILPLALVMEDLKGKIVKGRRPNPEAEARKAAKLNNPNAMERATCGCCFANQAVLPNGKIHDHGYRKPRAWQKTGSCYGRDFLPLEVSDAAPRFMVDLLTKAEASTVQGIANLRKATKLSVQRGSKRNEYGVRVPVFEDIAVGHPDFASAKASRVREEEHNLSAIRSDLAEFKKVVAEWKAA